MALSSAREKGRLEDSEGLEGQEGREGKGWTGRLLSQLSLRLASHLAWRGGFKTPCLEGWFARVTSHGEAQRSHKCQRPYAHLK